VINLEVLTVDSSEGTLANVTVTLLNDGPGSAAASVAEVHAKAAPEPEPEAEVEPPAEGEETYETPIEADPELEAELVFTYEIPELAPDDTYELVFQWLMGEIPTDFRVVFDASGTVADADPSNNTSRFGS
jgi:hypothetical protein